MRVVVTGGSGNVGTAVIRQLLGDPLVTSIVGVARRPTHWAEDAVEWQEVDLASEPLDGLLAGADAVIHLAWQFHPIRRPEQTWAANVGGTKRVLAAAAGAGVGVVVHASSVGAYSPVEHRHPLGEHHATDSVPTAAYGREKAYVERLLDIFERDQPDVRVARLRPAFVLGSEPAVEQRRIFAGPFVPTSWLRPGRIPVIPDPGLRFQVVHRRDVAVAFHRALVEGRGAYDVATEPVVGIDTVAELLEARTVAVPRRLARAAIAAAWRARLIPVQPELFDLFVRVPIMSTARIREELGWRPTVDGRATLASFFDGLRDRTGFPTPPLRPETSGPARVHELATGVGASDP